MFYQKLIKIMVLASAYPYCGVPSGLEGLARWLRRAMKPSLADGYALVTKVWPNRAQVTDPLWKRPAPTLIVAVSLAMPRSVRRTYESMNRDRLVGLTFRAK